MNHRSEKRLFKKIPRKIKLKTHFKIDVPDSEWFVLPEEVKNVNDLLLYMGREINFSFVDSTTGELERELEILVNNKEIWFYPEALKHPLMDGDVVEVYLLPLGGG